MSSIADNNWHDANRHYLAAALEWLRLRLKKQAQQWQTLVTNSPAPNPIWKDEPASLPQKHGFFRRTSVYPSPPVLLPRLLLHRLAWLFSLPITISSKKAPLWMLLSYRCNLQPPCLSLL